MLVLHGHSVLHGCPHHPRKTISPFWNPPAKKSKFSIAPTTNLTPLLSMTDKNLSFLKSKCNCKKVTTILNWVILSNTMQSVKLDPRSNYLFKVNKGNTRKRLEICSKLTTTTPE